MVELTVCIDTGRHTPLYQQLYDALSSQIRRGVLRAGDKLPGKRSLAAQLSLAVNTVDTAYQMLAAEGYIESRVRSGFYVLPYESGVAPLPGELLPRESLLGKPLSGESLPGEPLLEKPLLGEPPLPEKKDPEPAGFRFDLSTGGVDVGLFPFRTWGKLQRELLYSSPELLCHGSRQGDDNLRAALCEYLRAYRGVVCNTEQVVVGAGAEYLLGLAAQLFRGRRAAVENPGYRRACLILENNSVSCIPVAIDREGLPRKGLEESGASLCYVTPSHHFPTAVTMPVGRRAQLLAWAAEEKGRYILEDDYDAEFRYDTRPLPSLQGMAGSAGPVLYLSTFSKSLAPSIRIACMVLPLSLLEQYRAMFGSYANTVSRFEQQTLCRFLQDGYFTRHLNRMRNVYKKRMEALIAALEEALGRDNVHIWGRHTGLHLLIQLRKGPSEAEMIQTAGALGVRLRGLSEYYMGGAEYGPPRTVVLGYASLQDKDVPILAALLKTAWGL